MTVSDPITETGAPDEITPAMLEAGVRAFRDYQGYQVPGDAEATVVAIFLALKRAAGTPSA